MKGLVFKILADKFWVQGEDNICYTCVARGNLKASGVFVGDYVSFDILSDSPTITNVMPRKNQLIRPPIANIDQLIIVISQIPAPDFMIVDKLILFSLSYGIEPCIVVNKLDLNIDICDYILKAYKNVVKNIVFTNAITGEGVDELRTVMENKLSAFAGQSAVGKSALVNLIMKKHASEVGEISIKNQKGKNTTRHSEIFFEDNIRITDTAGFTSLDEKLLPISYFELPYYYPDFLLLHDKCKYKSCAHVGEKVSECAVKQAVLSGTIDKQRYLRYKDIYKTLKEKWEKTHG